jgi:hypothetical protein
MNVQGRNEFTSIVQKVIFLSVSGQGLGLTVHAHRGLTIHLSWNPGSCAGSFQKCISRHTVQSAVWHAIIRQIRRKGLIGVCRCVYGTDVRLERETSGETCFYTTYEGVRYYCRCKFSFSLEIGESYETSLFLV